MQFIWYIETSLNVEPLKEEENIKEESLMVKEKKKAITMPAILFVICICVWVLTACVALCKVAGPTNKTSKVLPWFKASGVAGYSRRFVVNINNTYTFQLHLKVW